jgi:glucose/arabinose dehydrogenase
MKTLYLTLLGVCLAINSQAQFNKTTAISGLQYPIAFEVAPDGRFFITEKGNGTNTASQKSRIQVYSAAGSLLGTFYNLSDSTNSNLERGVLGIALDPDFATNHFVYVYYNHLRNGDERIRLVRFTESANVGNNPLIIFDLDVADNIPGNHVGGNLHFRPSQNTKIYFTLGDLGDNQTNPTANFANKLTNPYGKILRINKDGTIPTDNPYYDDGNPLTGNCDWIWSYGHRNPFDFCFGSNDSLYCSENGLNTWDEANLIRKGGFYGWAQCEGNYMNSSTTATCNVAGAVAPIVDWGSPVPSVTGIVYYSGTGWNALNHHLLVADYNNGVIYDCTLGNAPYYNVVSSKSILGDFSAGGLTALKQSADGCIYAMEGGYTANGKIYKICPMDVGVSENNSPALSLSVYPNPATKDLTVEINITKDNELRLNVTDLYGKTIYSEHAFVKTGKTLIHTDLREQGITTGIYFMQLKDAQTKEVLRSIKVIVE